MYRMRIHSGTYQGRPSRWVEPRTRWQFDLADMVDGLCSHYVRHWTPGDDPWPESLPLARIVEVVKEEFEQRGRDTVWTWCEQVAYTHCTPDEARRWARGLVLARLPALDPTTPKPSASA